MYGDFPTPFSRLSGSNQCLLQWAHERKWEVGPVNSPRFFLLEVFAKRESLVACSWNHRLDRLDLRTFISHERELKWESDESSEADGHLGILFFRNRTIIQLPIWILCSWLGKICFEELQLAFLVLGCLAACHAGDVALRFRVLGLPVFLWISSPKMSLDGQLHVQMAPSAKACDGFSLRHSFFWTFVGFMQWFSRFRGWEMLFSNKWKSSETSGWDMSDHVRDDSNTHIGYDRSNNAKAILSDFFLLVIGGIAEGLAEQSRWDSALDVLSLMSSVDVEEGCCKLSSYGGSVVCQIETCTECQSHPLKNQIIHRGYQALLWSKFFWKQRFLISKKNMKRHFLDNMITW